MSATENGPPYEKKYSRRRLHYEELPMINILLFVCISCLKLEGLGGGGSKVDVYLYLCEICVVQLTVLYVKENLREEYICSSYLQGVPAGVYMKLWYRE